jgi:hypothetical protein
MHDFRASLYLLLTREYILKKVGTMGTTFSFWLNHAIFRVPTFEMKMGTFSLIDFQFLA